MRKILFEFCALLFSTYVANASVFDKVETDTKGMTADKVVEPSHWSHLLTLILGQLMGCSGLRDVYFH